MRSGHPDTLSQASLVTAILVFLTGTGATLRAETAVTPARPTATTTANIMQAPNGLNAVRPGRWEFFTRLEKPAQTAAKAEAATRQVGTLGTTYSVCIGTDNAAPVGFSGACKLDNQWQSDGQVVWFTSCTTTKLHTAGVAQYHGDAMEATEVNSLPGSVDIIRHISGHYLGSCAAPAPTRATAGSFAAIKSADAHITTEPPIFADMGTAQTEPTASPASPLPAATASAKIADNVRSPGSGSVEILQQGSAIAKAPSVAVVLLADMTGAAPKTAGPPHAATKAVFAVASEPSATRFERRPPVRQVHRGRRHNSLLHSRAPGRHASSARHYRGRHWGPGWYASFTPSYANVPATSFIGPRANADGGP